MHEEWKELLEHPSYLVSDFGRVMNGESKTLLVPYVNQQGIPSVLLSKSRKQARRSVALLVARTFHGQHHWPHFNTPIHLDGNRNNCCSDNLAWRPRWFAVRYHQQFRRPALLDTPVQDIASGEVFRNSRHAAVAYGLLEIDILRSVFDYKEVFPARLFFRSVRD